MWSLSVNRAQEDMERAEQIAKEEGQGDNSSGSDSDSSSNSSKSSFGLAESEDDRAPSSLVLFTQRSVQGDKTDPPHNHIAPNHIHNGLHKLLTIDPSLRASCGATARSGPFEWNVFVSWANSGAST